MRVVVQVTSGIQSGRKMWLDHAETIKVGRTELADVAFPDDAEMSHEHFAIEFSTDGCRLHDLGSPNGTTINGHRVIRQAALHDGDKIVAGETSFVVSLEGAPAARAPDAGEGDSATDVPLEVIQQRLIAYFRQLPQPLFAILDAARDPLVLALLIQFDHQYQSLYAGIKGDALADVAPYLVKLPSDSPLLESLVEKGWGNSWGVYLTCDKQFDEVRKHFRHFLTVKTDEGKEVYFRFYDPRVLRVFLPTCLTDEADQFFGPLEALYLEDEKPEHLFRFAAVHHGAEEVIPLSAAMSTQG